MSWYKVTLTGDMARRHCHQLVYEVLDYHMEILTDDTVPHPGNKSFVYKLKDSPAGSCTFYFTPDAASSYKKIIDYYEGEPCFKPVPSDVAQAIGGSDATKFLNE